MTPSPDRPDDVPEPGEDDCGGDPPCWEGKVADHRDHPEVTGDEAADA